ncbi:MAG: aminomethyl-transferring glycine dehydrogenase subunit GcvPB [Candidatus Omnitrophica bacterium]|nr:aminomethyl-transferring glycine dehydrogenase subunit GcvPB [Candidatus Omnitrophota bacterium]
MRPLLFEIGSTGRRGTSLPALEFPRKEVSSFLPFHLLRKNPPELPEVSELDVVRHYTSLSKKNFSVDANFYPLGSCTMKYNPKVNEDVVKQIGFLNLHPYQEEETVQGVLELLYNLEKILCEIVGVDEFCLQPAAGAQGEFTGLLIMHAYHSDRGNPRKKILVPDSSHGTNPASAALCGYEVIQVKSNARGRVDLDELRRLLDQNVAGMMLTNPNTLGLFEDEVSEIAKLVHEVEGLLYYDGANLNPLLGMARPGDMGFDIVHLNTHKTFSTPHGGGGPGAGPVGVKKFLSKYLPTPRIVQEKELFRIKHDFPKSVGKLTAFYGNTGVLLRAYAYIRSLGREGLLRTGQHAILNANYLLKGLKTFYEVAYPEMCMHEFVLTATRQKEKGVRALDIAKRLIDFGIHPPTIYFPLIVPEAMMIEPTETESRQTLDHFIEVMKTIAKEVEENPTLFRQAPMSAPVRRLDEVWAARHPVLKWEKKKRDEIPVASYSA